MGYDGAGASEDTPLTKQGHFTALHGFQYATAHPAAAGECTDPISQWAEVKVVSWDMLPAWGTLCGHLGKENGGTLNRRSSLTLPSHWSLMSQSADRVPRGLRQWLWVLRDPQRAPRPTSLEGECCPTSWG